MVKRVFNFLSKEVSGLHEAAYLLAFFAFLSQVLALFRDRLFAAHFGPGEILDAYYAAFRLPDAILATAASIVSASILIPFIVEKLKKSKEAGREFIDGLFSVFFVFIIAVSLLVFIFAPEINRLLFPGFNAEFQTRLVMLCRIMLLQPIFLGSSNLFASITQVHKKFFVYALSPVLYNIGIISGIVVFYPLFGIPGLAWGVVLGAVLHFAVQVPVLWGVGMLPRPIFRLAKIDWKEIKRIVLISLPRTLALSANSLSVLFLLAIGSVIGAGAISIFNLAWNLQSVPLTIIGSSYSLAAFPILVGFLANGEKGKFLEQMESAIRHLFFWTAPATVLFIVLRAQIVRVIYGSGNFNWTDTRLTAAALALFAFSAVAQGLILLFIRGYYAGGNTKKPLFINLVCAALVAAFGYYFNYLFGHSDFFRFFLESLLKVSDLKGAAVLALPLAYSVATLLNLGAFWFFFQTDFAKFSKKVGETFFQCFSASVIMGFASYLYLNVFNSYFSLRTVSGVFFQGFFSGIIGIIVGIILLKLLGSEELAQVWRTLHSKIWKAKPIPPDVSQISN